MVNQVTEFLFVCLFCFIALVEIIFLVALEENNLMVCPGSRGRREMLDAGEGLFIPLGPLRCSLSHAL